MSTKNLVIFFLAATSVIACSPEPEQRKEEPPIQKPIVKDTVVEPQEPTTNRFNDISGILSGVDESGNTLRPLFDTVAWKEHKAFIDESWSKLRKNRLDLMETWTKQELPETANGHETVFYPFSGPDFLTANAFFPNAKKIIMLGLEPVGSLPAIDQLTTKQAEDYSNDFKRSLTDIFEKSYFITKYMLRDFQKQEVNGLLPVMCFFIKKTDHKILDIKYMIRKVQDSIVEQDYATQEKPFGVKITCRKGDVVKTVYYFKYDVSNKLFNDTCVFYKFINTNTSGAITYIKSASYLLHAAFMNNMKELILKNSDYVLQDDTGIPYNYFEESGNWNLKLYGKYTKPVKDFSYLSMQKSIQKAIKRDSANIPELPFHLGYHWGNNKDLLIFASKKK